MTRTRVLVLAVAAALAAGVAPAAGGTDALPPLPRAPVPGRGVDRSMAEVVAALLPGAPQPAGSSAAPAAEEPLATWTHAEPAGDLDGDGLADLVVEAGSYETGTFQARGVRGKDGTTLWTTGDHGSRDVAAPALRDLDGVPGDDLLRVALEDYTVTERECFQDEYCWDQAATYRWRYGVASGRTGDWLWSTVVEGWHRNAPDEGLQGEDTTSVRLGLLPTGDTAAVRAVTTATAHETTTEQGDPLLGTDRETRSVRTTVRLATHPAGSGAAPAVTALGPYPAAYAYPQGAELTGDGVPDLLLDLRTLTDQTTTCTRVVIATVNCRTTYPRYGHSAVVVDGAAAAEAWAVASADDPCCMTFAYVLPLDADGDGDGAPDVVLEQSSYDLDGGLGTSMRRLVSGRTGEVAWSDGGDGWLTPLRGDLDGDGAHDLLDVVAGEDAATLRRLSGRSGAPLGETGVAHDTDPATDDFVDASPVADLDGDALPDVAVTHVRYDGERERTRAWVESAATGAVLLTVPEVEGWGSLVTLADLDGDGREELLHAAGSAVAALDGATGTARWRREVDPHAWSRPVPDLDGDGLPDVLTSAGGLAGLSGATGATLWGGPA